MKFAVKVGVATLVLAMAFTLMPVAEFDAVYDYDIEYNCNEYELSFIYSGGTSGDITVTWSALGIDGSGKELQVRQIGDEPSSSNFWKVRFDPQDVKNCKTIYVSQVVERDGEGDVMTIKVNVLTPPPADNPFIVTFYDGYSGKILYTEEVGSYKVVPVGKDFIKMPETPDREGYAFLGWFVSKGESGDSVPFNPKIPVESNIDIFAKWVKDDGSAPLPNPEPDPENKPVEIVSLQITGDYKKEYGIGQYLDTSGMRVIASMSDGSRSDVTSKCTYGPTYFDHAGIVTITVAYQGCSTTFDIVVTDTYVPSGPGGDDGGNEGGGSEGGEGQVIVIQSKTDALVYVLLVLVILLIAFIAYRELRNRRS